MTESRLQHLLDYQGSYCTRFATCNPHYILPIWNAVCRHHFRISVLAQIHFPPYFVGDPGQVLLPRNVLEVHTTNKWISVGLKFLPQLLSVPTVTGRKEGSLVFHHFLLHANPVCFWIDMHISGFHLLYWSPEFNEWKYCWMVWNNWCDTNTQLLLECLSGKDLKY